MQTVASADSIAFENVSKNYGSTNVIRDFSLNVAAGEFLTLLGPSGSGKTTVLSILAGFTDASSGRVRIGERDVTSLPPERRNLGMVFQSFALFPNMNVLSNVMFPLRMRGVSSTEARRLALKTLERVDLASLAHRGVHELSGGQKQRVAIARALVFRPPVLLMDECLSSLDLKLREQLQLEIRRLHREAGSTILFVTHDQGEAMSMSDRVAVMQGGKLMQVGRPDDIYFRPAHRFVASFIGKNNLFEIASGTLPDSVPGHARLPKGALIAVRPEALQPVARDRRLDVEFEATVIDSAFKGTTHDVLLESRSGRHLYAQLPVNQGAGAPPSGAAMRVGFSLDDAHLVE